MRLAVFAFNVLLGAGLLMLVQPMVARMLLPHLGGSPGVWNACMVFFQTGLLAGYAYAHLGPRWLGASRDAVLHGVLLALAIALLPIDLPAPDEPPARPVLWMLRSLAFGVFIPYALLAATSTLTQAWFARTTGDDPYFLYAASNLGSFLGLWLYPLVFEPRFGLVEQASVWRYGYVAFVLAMGGAIALSWPRLREPVEAATEAAPPAIAVKTIVRWVLLAMAPSSLLLSVTQHLTTDLAPVPLLWILPLSIYLLTFTIAFARRPIVPHAIVVRYRPVVILMLAILWFSEGTSPLPLIAGILLLGFAWMALLCHGELARTRPPAPQLAAFYFWIALGGALGGAFNVLLVPIVSNGYVEYPLMLALVAGLKSTLDESPVASRRTWLAAAAIGVGCIVLVLLGRLANLPPGPASLALVAVPLVASIFLSQPGPYSLAISGILLAAVFYPSVQGETLESRRSFFGVHRVTRDGDLIKLVHGNTVHGVQSRTTPAEPLAYYHRQSPIAAIIDGLNAEKRLKTVGIVGLGAGALAAYAQPGQDWTFFEIDPDVVALAKSRFTHLDACRGNLAFVVGDARLTLKKGDANLFDLLVIDAFGSDSIPTHLLTREALEIYERRLAPGGVLAIHVSNRYLDLTPVLANAATFGWVAFSSGEWPMSKEDEAAGKSRSWWIVMARNRDDLANVVGPRWSPMTPRPDVPAWTDDFLNLAAAVRWNDLWRSE